LKYCLLLFALLAGACNTTANRSPGGSEGHGGTVSATSWVGFRINELALYDRLNAEEKDELRSRFWLDLDRYKITCPEPKPLNRITLHPSDSGGVLPEEMERQVRNAVQQVDPALDIYSVKSNDYECVGGVPTCKRLYPLSAASRPFVSSYDTRVGPISATFDITLVIPLR